MDGWVGWCEHHEQMYIGVVSHTVVRVYVSTGMAIFHKTATSTKTVYPSST